MRIFPNKFTVLFSYIAITVNKSVFIFEFQITKQTEIEIDFVLFVKGFLLFFKNKDKVE